MESGKDGVNPTKPTSPTSYLLGGAIETEVDGDSPPPSPVQEFRGPVRFVEDLSWCHGSGHEVYSGQVGEVAWQFGDRLAIWVGGVLLHSVPVDAVIQESSAAEKSHEAITRQSENPA